MRRWAVLIGWELALVAAAAGMVALGRGVLASPPAAPGAWTTWAAEAGPAPAAVTVLRLAVLAASAYLAGATALAAAAEVWRKAALTELADLVALPAVRHAVTAGLGIGLSGATLAAGAAAFAGSPAHTRAGAAPVAPTLTPLTVATTTSTTTTTTTTTSLLGAPERENFAVVHPEAGVAGPATWTVRGGDHLWSIAERLLSTAWGRPASDVEVAPYWRLLVETNRPRLRDPRNADLVYAGDELLVPDLPSPGS